MLENCGHKADANCVLMFSSEVGDNALKEQHKSELEKLKSGVDREQSGN